MVPCGLGLGRLRAVGSCWAQGSHRTAPRPVLIHALLSLRPAPHPTTHGRVVPPNTTAPGGSDACKSRLDLGQTTALNCLMHTAAVLSPMPVRHGACSMHAACNVRAVSAGRRISGGSTQQMAVTSYLATLWVSIQNYHSLYPTQACGSPCATP